MDGGGMEWRVESSTDVEGGGLDYWSGGLSA
jgi:hypothetical protein